MALATALCVAPGVGQEVEVESSYRPNSPISDPLSVWRIALKSLPPGARIRRLAFADHILFVFHSAPGDNGIRALTLTPTAEGYFAEEDGERDASICSADGIDPERVEHGLRRILASEDWRRHSGRLDSLMLECWSPELNWTLLPIPEGGFKSGVPVERVTLPFEPGPVKPMPLLEKD